MRCVEHAKICAIPRLCESKLFDDGGEDWRAYSEPFYFVKAVLWARCPRSWSTHESCTQENPGLREAGRKFYAPPPIINMTKQSNLDPSGV